MDDILGFDISMHNSEGHPIDWSQVPTDKYRFVLIKATEGATYEDPWFDRHWTAAHARGFVVGAYHFFRSNRTGQQQADNIIKNILNDANFGLGDLPVAIDVEELKTLGSAGSAVTVKSYLAELKICFDAVESEMGTPPILYTANYVWKALKNPADFTDYPLWIAFPDTPAVQPLLPAPFTESAIWQYSFQGAVPGITGPVDLDRFQGGEDEFENLLLQ